MRTIADRLTLLILILAPLAAAAAATQAKAHAPQVEEPTGGLRLIPEDGTP